MTLQPQSGAAAALPARTSRRVLARTLRAVSDFVRAYPVAGAGGFLVLVFVGLAIAAGAVHDRAYDQDLIARLTPPAWQGGGGIAHPLGTDTLGRDVLARVMTAVGISLEVSVAAVAISSVLGVLLGMVAGYAGGWLDDVIMRIADSVLAIPLVLLAISVIAVLGPGIRNLILVIAFTQWMTYARTARAESLVLREQPYVVAARSLGARHSTVLLRHVLPHLLPSAIALATLNLSIVILLEAGLSYLGLGVQLPDPSLGSMLSEGRQYINRASWLAIWPGVSLLLLVLGLNLLGNGLRSHVSPHSKARRA